MTVDQELFADTLPTYLTRFIGRSLELQDLVILARFRLVTICGVGGIGKTRLAIELAKILRANSFAHSRYSDTFWVPLVGVTNSADVPAAVAAGIGLQGPTGDHAVLALANTLRDRPALLVLDNCEHIAAACRELLTTLLARCPNLTVLTTSRIPLGLEIERVYVVPPMRDDAIDLFAERAVRTAPTYALTAVNSSTIGDICERLGGLPLAIELAASWINVLSPRDLLSKIDDTMDMPSHGPVEDRHRSMHGVLDSSWQWLSEDDRSGQTLQFRSHLDEEPWTQAYEQGERLTPEDAVALAGDVIDRLAARLAAHPVGLTEREIEVLRLVADGMDNSAIADHLVVSPRTVHAHLRSVYAKLGVTTRTAAAHEAQRLHLV